MLPEALHTEIILRISNLDAVAPEIIDDIDDVLRNEIQAMGSISSQKIGGVEPIAEMLNLMDKSTEEQILDNLEEDQILLSKSDNLCLYSMILLRLMIVVCKKLLRMLSLSSG